jgi:hypothetical protein
MIYIITYTALIFSIFADTYAIHRYGTLKGLRKFFHLAIPYSIIGTVILVRGDYKTILFLSATWWLLKDAAMGYILHRDVFHLGTGKWDQFWSRTYPMALLGLKLMLIFFGYSFIINF